MPCRSDYMEPTNQERAAVSVAAKELLKVADKYTHEADILREFVLATRHAGNIEGVSAKRIVEVSKIVAASDKLMNKGEKLINDLKGMYAYQVNGASVVDAYLKAYKAYYPLIINVIRLLSGESLPEKKYLAIEKAQVAHRKEDIARLIKVFADKKDFPMVLKLAGADCTKPLEDQIGFDPDKY